MPTSFETWMNGQERDPFDLPASDVALLVVDMQNWFCKDEPGVTRPPGRSIETRLCGFNHVAESTVRDGEPRAHLVCPARYRLVTSFVA